MTIWGWEILAEAAARHPDASPRISRWIKIVERENPASFVELKRAFGSADYVKPFTIFDLGGNRYRLVAWVDYAEKAITVSRLMRHAEYMRWSRSR